MAIKALASWMLVQKASPSVVQPGSALLSQAEILSALSFALDLTEDAVPGHALRSCILGMRLGRELGLPGELLGSLYYALMLKDIGCSSNSARLCQIIGGGDERAIKRGVKLEDWTRPSRLSLSGVRLLWRNMLPGANPLQRTLGMVLTGIAQHRNNEEMIGLRCDRGASIIRKLGLGQQSAEAVRGLDEHWDGSGYPERRRGRAIPILARILAVAQHLDVFASEKSPDFAMSVLSDRSGRWFDPELVRVAERLHRAGMLWHGALPGTLERDTRRTALDLAPAAAERLSNADIDNICSAFADVVDAKSSFTYNHSMGVTEAAVRIAAQLGLSEERRQFVHRAALLHDIGKLRVPNCILDKPGKLDTAEWQVVQEHPRLTREILARIRPFRELAFVAGAHHERLDGTGYPDRLTGDQIPLEARIIAVADVYGALTEDRPYRAGMPIEEAARIMSREIDTKLDTDCCEALFAAVS